MSVALSNIALSTGPVMAGYEGFVLAAFTAGFARALGQGVAPDPLPDDPAHGVVFGKKTHSTKLRFAKECLWVIEPNGG